MVKEITDFYHTYDAIHGTIDIRDASKKYTGQISSLLRTQALDRLRRIKQLSFVSLSYPSADHSRFGHALGTLQMVRTILNHLWINESFKASLFKELKSIFQDPFNGKVEQDQFEVLLQHMLVAGLMQDLGELPFSQATKHFLYPSKHILNQINASSSVYKTTPQWNNKKIFTVAALTSPEVRPYLNGLNIDFLIFLVTGFMPSSTGRSALRTLSHILDGVVDADRLDYVFRDAHHTIGTFGTPKTVIESLLYFDELGPVFSEPSPVSNFLAMRAHLYSNVYLNPLERFQTMLLRDLMLGVIADKDTLNYFFEGKMGMGLDFEDFIKLDDYYLISRINNMKTYSNKSRLGLQSLHALEMLFHSKIEYSSAWLPPSNYTNVDVNFKRPQNLYFDTFFKKTPIIYEAKSVRIKSNKFKLLGDIIPLEKCGGFVGSVVESSTSILPQKGSILLFLPPEIDQNGPEWKAFHKGLKEGWIYKELAKNDPLSKIYYSSDTRRLGGFVGPDIFISYTEKNLELVNTVVAHLYSLKRKYFLYTGDKGDGRSALENSKKAVRDCKAAFIILTKDYIRKYSENSEGYVATEVSEMIKQVARNKIKIFVLSDEVYGDIKEALPWDKLGLPRGPVVFNPLKNLSGKSIETVIEALIASVEDEFA